MSEKTESPTPQRLRDARRKGQIARSRLLSSAAVTAGGLLGLAASAQHSAARLSSWLTAVLTTPRLEAPGAELAQALAVLGSSAAPVMLGAFAAALLVCVPQAGLQLNVGAVAMKAERLDPFEGLKKLVSRKQLFEMLKGAVVAVVMALMLYSSLRDAAPLVSVAAAHHGGAAFGAVLGLLARAVARAVAVLLALGAFDYWLARRGHRRELMMTRDEVRREHKSNEGDPHHKAKRKQLHAQLANGGPARGVHKATAVIVNPTHIAVAIRYDETEAEAPYLVAKGREEVALNLRREAQALQIPVIRDVPLARALVHYDVGEAVPEELYAAAAAVLKVAYQASESRDADHRRLAEETR